MALYEVIAYLREESWSKAYLEVEASSLEEALELAKSNPKDYWDGDAKEIYGSFNSDWADEDEWEVTKLKD